MRKILKIIVILSYILFLSFVLKTQSSAETEITPIETTPIRITQGCSSCIIKDDTATCNNPYDISRVQDSNCSSKERICSAANLTQVFCEYQECKESISTCGSGGCSSTEKRVCYLGDSCAYACQCVSYDDCNPPTNTPAPNNPTRTPTPKPPTATPVPARPALCKSATISKTSLGPGESLTITSTANTNQIKTFSYAFYNLDNLFGPNNPKPIYFVANTHYIVANPPPPIDPPSNTITVNYDDLNKPDLNWNSKKPTKIHVLAYFTNTAGGFSLPEAPCVVDFQIQAESGGSCAWSAPIPISTLPGSGSIQTQAEVIYPNNTQLLQSFYRGDQGYWRIVPVVNGNPVWASAGAWSAPISVSTLPGSGTIQTRSDFIIGNGANLIQALWRGDKGFWRIVPVVNGKPQWSCEAAPTKTPTPLSCQKSQGDADCNGKIDLKDFEIWRKEFTGELTTKTADFNKDTKISLADFEIWRSSYYK